jgi:hypothetical protein
MCTIVAGLGSRGPVIGRNFDWLQCGGRIQILPSRRRYGRMCLPYILIEQQGIDRPYEGINSSGLFIGMTSTQGNPPDSDRVIEFDALGVMAYVLERATTAAIGISILESCHLIYNQNDNYTFADYLIADSQGTIFMYQEGQIRKKYEVALGDACVLRAGLSISASEKCSDKMIEEIKDSFRTTQSMVDACQIASAHDTAWSTVYELKEKTLSLYIEQNYQMPFNFDIDDLLCQGENVLDFGNLKLSRIKTRDDLNRYTYRISAQTPSGFPKFSRETE